MMRAVKGGLFFIRSTQPDTKAGLSIPETAFFRFRTVSFSVFRFSLAEISAEKERCRQTLMLIWGMTSLNQGIHQLFAD